MQRLAQNNQRFNTLAAAGSSGAAMAAGGLTHHQDVIVNGLGNTHNVADHAVLLTLGLDSCCSSIAAVAAHYKHHVYAPHIYSLHNLPADVHAAVNSSHGLKDSLSAHVLCTQHLAYQAVCGQRQLSIQTVTLSWGKDC